MVEALNEILRHERKHFNFYLQALMELKGKDRIILKSLLEKEMMGELGHIRDFGDKIVALGGLPTKESHDWSNIGSGSGVIGEAIKMEREVLRVYHEFYPLAERYASEYNDKSVVLLLEENIEHTTKDVEEMEKL